MLNVNSCWHLNIYEHDNIHAQLSWAWKKLYNLEAWRNTVLLVLLVNSFSETKKPLHSPPSTIASIKPTRRIQRSNSAEDLTPSKNHKVCLNFFFASGDFWGLLIMFANGWTLFPPLYCLQYRPLGAVWSGFIVLALCDRISKECIWTNAADIIFWTKNSKIMV